MVHSYLRDILLQQLKFDPFSIISGQNKLGDLRIYFILGGGAHTTYAQLKPGNWCITIQRQGGML